MQAIKNETSELYVHVQSLLKQLLDNLNSNVTDKSEDVQETTAYSHNLLTKLFNDVVGKMQELEKHAEWDTFTVALYGETNAGKSTIIETLRMLLGEKTKLEQQQQFLDWSNNAGISAQKVENLKSELKDLSAQLDAIEIQRKEEETSLANDLELRLSEKELAELQLSKLKESASLFAKILWLFVKPEEAKLVSDCTEKYDDLQVLTASKKQEYEQTKESLTIKHNQTDKECKNSINAFKEALPFADGSIIGDGQSDFTRETTTYRFEVDGCKFNLLDVPGIEGKEDKVTEAIWEAVHKAHAVLYITSKAAAPQKGEGKNLGTLEKIKQHLGAQSEVRTIFNKRIQNPIQLSAKSLVSTGEQESLADLDTKMTECLGESYIESISLSGYPAFLAASQCLVPETRDYIQQQKFFSKFQADDILDKSQISSLTSMFSKSLVSEFKEKIIKSNHNKALLHIQKTHDEIHQLRTEKYKPLSQKLHDDVHVTNAELSTALMTFQSDLKAVSRELIRKFESNVRNEMYSEIDDNISNDRFKSMLSEVIEEQQQKLTSALPKKIKKELGKFESSLKDIIDRFEARTNELMASFNNIYSDRFNLDIKIDNGVNVWGIIGAIGGGIALFFTPAGWAVLAVSGVTLLFQAYKALRSFFSDDYKQSQQKESVESNLRNVSKDIAKNIDDEINNLFVEAENKVKQLENALSSSIEQIQSIESKLEKSCIELKGLYQQLGCK